MNFIRSRCLKFMITVFLISSVHTSVMHGVYSLPSWWLKTRIKSELTDYGNRFLQSNTFKHIKYAGGFAVVGGSVAASKGFIKTILGGGSLFDGLFDMVSYSLTGGLFGWVVCFFSIRDQESQEKLKNIERINKEINDKLKESERRYKEEEKRKADIDSKCDKLVNQCYDLADQFNRFSTQSEQTENIKSIGGMRNAYERKDAQELWRIMRELKKVGAISPCTEL